MSQLSRHKINLPPYWKLVAYNDLLSQQKSLLWIIPSLRDLLSDRPVLPPAVFFGDWADFQSPVGVKLASNKVVGPVFSSSCSTSFSVKFSLHESKK
jgi:hypothetical protein